MNVHVYKDFEALSKEAAKRVEQQIEEKSASVLGLATGSTPIGLYRKMSEGVKKRGMSYRNVQTINLDEYLGLDPEHPRSYHTFMDEHLFKFIDIPEENRHLPNGKPDSVEEECRRYERLIDSIGPIDLQILGLGTNGHIGFNEPGTEEDEETHCVKLADSTREDNARFFGSIDEVPTHAITMGIRSILKSKEILLLASGKSKAEAVKTLLEKKVTKDFPASFLWNHYNVTLMVDQEAYGLVKTEGR
ncbi:glucosamine-6-phosphate deaminase [Planomicrobium sp. CPCC 101110]|uniref:glucosamine-6-phosphate deaminase n=1 Tax=Planomicrobium sp. CPCC 101110 TaxID=2599619 RepID=UPI0011B8535E|nr:glucosamine-6-phosphate deaminase [Planomicrobium sp. CPCC 101110]TWT25367.1 glucosamine-6-phosphate deaminase [Planomicrobium sp. CPCC 101110]